MRHIKMYEEQGLDNKSKMIGVIVHIFAYGRDINVNDYYACVAPTFWDVGTAILEDYMDPEEADEKSNEMHTLYDLAGILSDHIYDADEVDVTVWSGLIPRSQEEKYDSVGSINPYSVVEDIDKMFTNAKAIMTASHGGSSSNEIGIKLVGDSLANDPNKLAIYANDADFEKIVRYAGFPEDKIKSLLKFNQIRNQI